MMERATGPRACCSSWTLVFRAGPHFKSHQFFDRSAMPVRSARGSGLWIVSTSDPQSQSADGAFVDALVSVLQDPAWVPEGGAEYLNPVEAMVYGVNGWLTRNQLPQQVEWDAFAGRERPVFISNPH